MLKQCFIDSILKGSTGGLSLNFSKGKKCM